MYLIYCFLLPMEREDLFFTRSLHTHTKKEPPQIASLTNLISVAASALSCKSTLWLATCCQTTWLPTFQVGRRDIFKAMWPKCYGEGNTVLTPSCMRPLPEAAVTCPAEQQGLLRGPVHLEACSALEKCLCLEFIQPLVLPLWCWAGCPPNTLPRNLPESQWDWPQLELGEDPCVGRTTQLQGHHPPFLQPWVVAGPPHPPHPHTPRPPALRWQVTPFCLLRMSPATSQCRALLNSTVLTGDPSLPSQDKACHQPVLRSAQQCCALTQAGSHFISWWWLTAGL